MSKPPKLPNAVSSWGAQMGRPNEIHEPDEEIKFHLYRVAFVDGDYDNGGAYWGGGGLPLYHAYGDGPEYRNEMFVRARNREDAKQQVQEEFSNAKFYR